MFGLLPLYGSPLLCNEWMSGFQKRYVIFSSFQSDMEKCHDAFSSLLCQLNAVNSFSFISDSDMI